MMVAVMVVSSVVVGQATAAPAGTDHTVTVGEAAAALADVASVTGPSAMTVASSEGFTAMSAGSVVELPKDPTDGLSLTTADGASIEIGLPGAANADDGVRQASGEVVYADALPDVAVAAQATPDGGMRALVVIDGPQAPTEFRFPMVLPAGASLVPASDGGANMVGADGNVVIAVAAPWAYDANGAAVRTAYRIEGATLIQTVAHHQAAYPVVADPAFYEDCGWTTCTRWISVATTKALYNNRMNTVMAGQGGIAAVMCGLLVAASGPAAPAVGLACVVWTAWLVADLANAFDSAHANRGCVKWKWSRQLGKAVTVDFDWTTPSRTGKCKWS
jgi:hypothetical protein